jgi:hypothetical protein
MHTEKLMAHAKQQVKTIIESLPDDLSTDQVMEELRFRLLVEQTFQELSERGVMDKRASLWIQK